MGIRHLLIGAILGSLVLAIVPVTPQHAEAAQTTVKKKEKKPSQNQKKQQQHPHGQKNYPWGEPNAGWDDRCIFYFDTYDGWIPPFCRPYGRAF
ncbi:hypothetical protein G5V57_09985 [Nordella sp. HKS 07]|uniref:hypothetical protein n=1 Tax=Nordella sp. HKS 07 TaxID=2712222 RepID=UPI0013E17229|nr:hypothetical protein [Nordella sp. HKS 07]QIG48021.1 hypothetical protein G5V57_09985 [Nordella sp. HKS 07]